MLQYKIRNIQTCNNFSKKGSIKIMQKLPIQWPYYKNFHKMVYTKNLIISITYNSINTRKSYLTYLTDVLFNTGSNQNTQFERTRMIIADAAKNLPPTFWPKQFFAWCIIWLSFIIHLDNTLLEARSFEITQTKA